MYEPRPIPWSQVQSWTCNACGECCKWFSVPLNAYEYAKLGQTYGFNMVEVSDGRSWLRKSIDDRCAFMILHGGRWLCGLQGEKPNVCKIWPFRVTDRPLYGRGLGARYENEEWTGYVYVDPRCPAIVYGDPTPYFTHNVIREFVELALGKIEHQSHSTADLPPSHLWRDPMRQHTLGDHYSLQNLQSV